MLNRAQRLMLFRAHHRNSLFGVPKEILREITQFGQDPDSDVAKALHSVAYGKLETLKAMLDAASNENPPTKLKELLLLTSTTLTPAGLTIKHKTLLECAVEAGDTGVVALIKTYFVKFAGGEEEMERQLSPYPSLLDATKNQAADDLTDLLAIIKHSSLTDVRAELATGEDYDPTYQSNLRTAMNKFRADKLAAKQRTITKPQMHCNYQNLLHAYKLLTNEWENLQVGIHAEKCFLFARQVIGFIQLTELPAIDRCTFARFQLFEARIGRAIERTFVLRGSDGEFPDYVKCLIDSHTGVGFDSYIGTRGHRPQGEIGGLMDVSGFNVWFPYEQLIKAKILSLQNLCKPSSPKNQCANYC